MILKFQRSRGSYSTNPYEPTVRITELKQMVQTLHDNNLRVVMDVVYNHMYNAAESNFHKLVQVIIIVTMKMEHLQMEPV